MNRRNRLRILACGIAIVLLLPLAAMIIKPETVYANDKALETTRSGRVKKSASGCIMRTDATGSF